MPSLTTVLPQQPGGGGNEKAQGRAASGGISGRARGAMRDTHTHTHTHTHTYMCTHPPGPHCPSPSRWAELGAEAGGAFQAGLTAHRQAGRLAGRDVVGHVALPHEGADPQLLRGFLRPPQAGAGRGQGDRLCPCRVERAAELPQPSSCSL